MIERLAPTGSSLTPAERRVLEVMRTADSIEDAARDLGRSPNTVKRQLAIARSKLGVRTTRQAIAITFGITLSGDDIG